MLHKRWISFETSVRRQVRMVARVQLRSWRGAVLLEETSEVDIRSERGLIEMKHLKLGEVG